LNKQNVTIISIVDFNARKLTNSVLPEV